MDIEKARSGVYMNTPENRKKGRVGQRYGEFTSEDEFKRDGEWSTERKEMHNRIVDKHIGESKRIGPVPRATFMLGGSGAGKGTVLKHMGDAPEISNMKVIDPDEIKMDDLKEDYERYNFSKSGSAAKRLHSESSMLSKRIVDGIIDKRNDFLKDGTFSSYEKDVAKLKEAISKGYNVSVVGVTIPLSEAVSRAKQRAERTGRAVPMQIIKKAHKGASESFLRLIEDGYGKHLTLYDNMQKPPKLIYKDGKVIDPELFKQFSDKAGRGVVKKSHSGFIFSPDEYDNYMRELHSKTGKYIRVEIPSDYEEVVDERYLKEMEKYWNS